MSKLTVFLTLAWALSLLYGEMFAFWIPYIWSCSWPRPPSSVSKVDNPGDYVKIAVLADPQLMDKTSLRLAPKSLALEMAQFYTDLFMRRAFLSSIFPFKPDVILFLGDYFDGGPFLTDKDFSSFHKCVFLFICIQVIRRYEKVFGVRNYHFTIGAVNFIAVDAQTLDGKPQGIETATTWNFVKEVSKNITSRPSVLLTHIPLYRPDWTSCGPYRASPFINQRINRDDHDKEILYQNYVTEEHTNHLLELIKPALILSGHDHDQCTIVHTTKHGAVKEMDLNPQMPSPLESAFSLLKHTFIYVLVLFWPTNGFPLLHQCMRSLISSSIFEGVKEKIDDDFCEYEEVWDVEGSMHLIRKISKASPPTHSSHSSMESLSYTTAKTGVIATALKPGGGSQVECNLTLVKYREVFVRT
ncbi:hypothetical protein DM860_018146 [Cuscuta australis]|uniref:Calcineurin-like phosphoesterase domain-containing protein n=1 Tax=Cuscuta australis TaxID=267555 RepID=A0A328DMW8_9ASTE|nr:hypothetical protein DM860_018146 [Cuscuta australis]